MKKLVRIVSTLFLGFSLSGCMNVEEQKNIVNISILNSKVIYSIYINNKSPYV